MLVVETFILKPASNAWWILKTFRYFLHALDTGFQIKRKQVSKLNGNRRPNKSEALVQFS